MTLIFNLLAPNCYTYLIKMKNKNTRWLLHLVHPGRAWVDSHPTQWPRHSTKCNSPPINSQCTHRTVCACLRYYSLNMHLVDLHTSTSRRGPELNRGGQPVAIHRYFPGSTTMPVTAARPSPSQPRLFLVFKTKILCSKSIKHVVYLSRVASNVAYTPEEAAVNSRLVHNDWILLVITGVRRNCRYRVAAYKPC